MNLDIPPCSLSNEWYLGSGKPDNEQAVEILLTPGFMVGNIQPRHIRLFHATTTGLLMLEARHGNVIVHGTREMSHREALVVGKEMGIAIFGFMYSLKLTDVTSSLWYREKIAKTVVEPSHGRIVSTITPTPATASLGPWRYYPAFEGGASSTVYRA